MTSTLDGSKSGGRGQILYFRTIYYTTVLRPMSLEIKPISLGRNISHNLTSPRCRCMLLGRLPGCLYNTSLSHVWHLYRVEFRILPRHLISTVASWMLSPTTILCCSSRACYLARRICSSVLSLSYIEYLYREHVRWNMHGDEHGGGNG
jgi:hypothetical protein